MVVSISRKEMIYEPEQAASNGNNAFDCEVVSNAKMIAVNKALDAPANMADMPMSAASGKVMPEEGNR